MTLFIRLLDSVVLLYVIVIAIRAFMSWLRPEVLYAYSVFFGIVTKLVDPLLGLVRKLFPSEIGRLDLSPVIAIVLVETLKYILIFVIVKMFPGAAA